MGKHKEWRKIAKKMRRKRLRTAEARNREASEKEEEEKRKMSPTYEMRLAEQISKQLAAKEMEQREFEENLKKWEDEERRVREETLREQTLKKERAEHLKKKKLEEEEIIRKSAEAESERKAMIAECLSLFSIGERHSLPDEMLIPFETQRGKEVCPFFAKVAACRFWDVCSRNHIRPAVSVTLLFPGFYSHFSISQISQAEYDTDMSLEYDDKETYSHFLEFYRDIRYEFESCGRLTRLLVCSNQEPHLRGNVYVSYATEREAMSAYLKFNGRFFGGRQLSCQFVTIPSWKSAICGLYFKKKCPKGNACNFLHVYRDPGPPFYEPTPQNEHSPDDWRWSESPERRPNTENGPRESDMHENTTRKKRRRNRKRSRSTERRRKSKSRERSTSKDGRRNRSSKSRRDKTSERRLSRSPKKKNTSEHQSTSSSGRLPSRSRSRDRNKKDR